MITVNRIDLRTIDMPLKEPFETSSGRISTKRVLLLELFDKSGIKTWSECVAKTTPNYLPETIYTCWSLIERSIAPLILNHSFEHPREIIPYLNHSIRGNLMAKAAVEMGIWSLYATLRNSSLSNILGGTRPSLETGISIGIQDSPKALVTLVQEAQKTGFRKIKVKIKPGADIHYLQAIRDELGYTIPLMADANNAYTLKDIEHLKRFDSLKLLMIEQPFSWDDIIHNAQLQKEIQTPICLDESITTLDKAKEMVTLKSGDIINIKPGRVGGLGPSLDIHDYCKDHYIPVWCGGMLETGIGRAYNVALASLPNFSIPGDISPSNRYWKEDIVSPEWTMSTDGTMVVRYEQVGLGIQIKEDMIYNTTIDHISLT